MKCKHCQEDFLPTERPYVSKQAGMEGDYHWTCFVTACRDRAPVGVGGFDAPVGTKGDGEDFNGEPAPPHLED